MDERRRNKKEEDQGATEKVENKDDVDGAQVEKVTEFVQK